MYNLHSLLSHANATIMVHPIIVGMTRSIGPFELVGTKQLIEQWLQSTHLFLIKVIAFKRRNRVYNHTDINNYKLCFIFFWLSHARTHLHTMLNGDKNVSKVEQFHVNNDEVIFLFFSMLGTYKWHDIDTLYKNKTWGDLNELQLHMLGEECVLYPLCKYTQAFYFSLRIVL